MAGSPKKRARREAERLKSAERATAPANETPPSVSGLPAAKSPAPVPVIQGELVDTEPTRTALKRAMRARAQQHADKAIAVLVALMDSPDEARRESASNKMLEWGFGKPTVDIDAGEGAQIITILRFGDQQS